jgi:hypothetical protein
VVFVEPSACAIDVVSITQPTGVDRSKAISGSKKKKKLWIDPPEVEFVRLIFKLFSKWQV